MFFKKTEKEYVNEIIFIDKQCWKSNATIERSWFEIRKYLNKKKLNKKDHPFLYEFKEKSVYVHTDKEIDTLLRELYDYNRELLKK